MIYIKDISGKLKLQVLELEGSVHRFELMKEDYILLKFSEEDPVYFDIGDYVETEEGCFYVTEPVYPVFNTSTSGYDYELKLESHYYRWKNHILFYDRQGNKEASWSLTRAPEAHLGIVVSNLRSLGFTYNGKEYQAVVDSTVNGEAKFVQYENTNIIDALTKMAEAWDCEWWVDGDKIYLGRLEYGDPVDLEIGKEIYSMSRSQSQDIYATRLYVFGSTRNIPSDYRQGESGTVVEGVVQKRLMLPEGTPYIDVVEGLKEEQVIESVVVLEEVYPKLIGTISSVKTVERTTGEGEESETFIAYQFTDESFTFSKEYIIPGETLKLQFQTGPLAGMEFELSFNPDELPEENPDSQVFEIVRNQNYGQWLPKEPLIPGVGNQYSLLNFDTKYVSDALIPKAEQELLEKGLTLKDKMVSDPSTYNCVINSYLASGYDENNGTLNPEKSLDLKAGQKVNLKNPAYFKDGRVTRVIGFEKKLDYPYDSPSYTIGETAAYSRLGELEQKIDSIQLEGNTYVNQGGGGSGFYVIKKDDPTAASDENVFSALRTLYEINKLKVDVNDMFLRKDINDTAHGIILFDKKIGSSVYLEGWEGKGWEIEETGAAELESLRVRSDIFVKNRIGSDTFVSGFPNGFGWDLSPYKRINAAEVEETKYRLEIDDIIVRGKLRVFEMIISQLRGENDNVIFAGMMKVDHYDKASKRIYLDTDEGVIYNPFRSGDILMVQRFGGLPSAGNNYNVIKQYELRVTDAGVGSLTDGEKRLDWITFSNFVGDLEDIAEGDVLTRVDSVTDSTRKGVVKITTIDEIGAPYIDVVYGMKTDPENATKVRIGNLTAIRTKSGIDLTDIWGIYANGAFIENSTYILNNGNTVEQEFSVLNGKLESTIGEIRNDMSLESGNILVNSTFSQNMNYWEAGGTVHFLAFSGAFLIANGEFMAEKDAIADIYQDGNRNVLRIRRSNVIQKNEVMDIPVHEETEEGEYTYSFSFYYKVLTSGTLTAGIEGSDLYVNESLSPTEDYVKMGHVGKWNETGDFKIAFTGEILIYGVSLFNDALADAEIRLQTQITQNAEEIKLTAKKEYVDSETGKIYTKYDAELAVTAEQISQRVTRSEFDAETGELERLLEGKITVQADRIDAVVSDIDYINNTIETAGWITTAQGNKLYASKTLEDGNTIVSYINQTATTVTISASKINLKGAVTFTMFDNSLQTKINDIESDASSALTTASQSWLKALQASNEAGQAQSSADEAIQEAAQAIQDAANAVNKAGSAQAAVNALPEWSKEASIIEALTSATVMVNGYIKTSMIDVKNLYCTSLAAVRGTIGGFTISSNSLVNSNYSSYIRITDSGENKRIAIGGSGSNCVDIQSYGTGNIGLHVLSNMTSGYAIQSYGAHIFGQRSSEVWNAPGLLGIFQVSPGNPSPSVSKIWGNGCSISQSVDSQNGKFSFRFNFSHGDFSVLGVLHDSSYNGFMQINSRSSGFVEVVWVNQNGDTIRPKFHLFVFGRNTW